MELFSYISKQRAAYETETIPLQEGDEFSQYQLIRKINFYWRSKYLTPAIDKVIGPYPFDNISKYRVLLEARATDFDTKHIEIAPLRPDRLSRASAMIGTKAIHKWMYKHNFGKTLDEITYTRAKYGGVLVKDTEDGIKVVPWENVIVDQSEIMTGIIIERYYYTPSELLRKGWDKALVRQAIERAEEFKQKNIGQTGDANKAETQGSFIEVWEIHGDIKKSMYLEAKGEEWTEDDEYEYVTAHIILANPELVSDGEHGGTVFYIDEDKESPYMYIARNPIAGRAMGEGVVESLFEHQKWHNFTKTEEMRMLAIAGKKVYVTDDPDVLANIFDAGVDHGTVLRVSQGRTFNELNQMPTGTPVYQVVRQEWSESGDRVTSSYSAKIGEESKSGTPFRAQYLQNVEASSQFEQYREEIGNILLKPLIEKVILPRALKELKKEDELFASFTATELAFLDEIIDAKLFNQKIVESIRNGVPVTEEMMAALDMDVKGTLKKMGSKRHIKELQELIENVPDNVVIHTTDEARNKAVYFESLSNALNMFAPEDPRRNAIIDRIMDAIGISKEEIELYGSQQPMAPAQNPQMKQEKLNESTQTGAVLSLA